MKIVRCTKCKRYIHESNKCFYCGNTIGFDEIVIPTIHENIVAEYSQIESLIESRKFTEAFILSRTVMEWMPTLPSIFWLRLLAKNKCANTAELLQRGFDCKKDADFINAMTFSSGVEHNTYQDVYDMVLAIQQALKAEILNHEFQCKESTKLWKIKETMAEKIDTYQNRLFVLWSDLEKTEQSMYELEKDCSLLAKEYVNDLNKAEQTASSIKDETSLLEECTVDNLHEFQIKICSILQQSEQAKAAIENMKKKNSLVESFNDLVKKRDEQISQINNELSLLRSYETEIQYTLDEIDQIEQKHRTAMHGIEFFDFKEAERVLGKNKYKDIFHRIGVDLDI